MTGTDKSRIAFRGLVTDPNELAITGDGAMRRFTNGVLTRPQLAQKRRGIAFSARNESAQINKFFNYDDTLLYHCGTGATGQLKSLSAGTITGITGQLNPVSGRLRACIASKNFYVAGTVVSRLSGVSSTPVAAGGLFSPGLDPAFTTLPAGSVLAASRAVAYRTVFGFTDNKDNLHLGEVSGRLLVINTSGATANPKLRARVPATASTSHFIQFYRSAAVAVDATDGLYHADDDLQLVYEQQLTATDISNGYLELTDVVTEALRGATIYTSPLLDGILATNRLPPGCLEIASHKGRAWFGNTTQPAEFFLNILSVGGTSGIQDGDVLKFSGLTAGFTLTAIRDFWCSLTRTAGTTVTVTTTEAHGYSTNDYVKLAEGSANFGIGPFQITVTGTYAFTYAEAGSNVTLADQYINKSTVSGAANGTYVARIDQSSGTAGARVEATTRNLVAAFVKHTGNSELWAENASGEEEVPGKILFRGRTPATTTFYVSTGAGSKRECFSPALLSANHTVNLARDIGGTVVTATVTAGSSSILLGELVTIAPGGGSFGVGPFTVIAVGATTFSYTEVGTALDTLAAQDAAISGSTDIGTAVAEIKPNRIYYSKFGEPEATTRNGWIDVGSSSGAIKAMFGQRGQLWVWKTDGIYRLLGGDDPAVVPSDLRVDPVDEKIQLLATESVALFAGRCWGLTDRGVVAVSESGVELMSGAISDDLIRANQTVLDFAADALAAGYGVISFETDCFATAYESDHAYILHIPAVFGLDGNSALDNSNLYGGCPMAFVFNTKSSSWGIWDWGQTGYGAASKRCAIFNPNDSRLYFGDGVFGSAGDGILYRERKTLDSTDYRDTTPHRNSVSLTRVGTTVTGTVATIQFDVGDSILISPGSANFSAGPHTITAVTATTFTYTQSGAAVTLASQYAYREKAIAITWAWVLQTMGAVGLEKRWDELKFIFAQRETYFPSGFTNSQKAFYLALANETASVSAFLVAAQETQISRVWVPGDVAYGTRLLITLTHSVIDEMFDLAGLGLKAEVLGGASTR